MFNMFNMFCITPELYIENEYEYSGQNYVNNIERQGSWVDNIIIQMQISPLSQL